MHIAIPAGINVKSKTCLLSGAGTTNLLGQVVEKFSADLTAKENQKVLVVVFPAFSVPDGGATLAGTWLADDAKTSSTSFSFEDKNPELSQVTLEGKPVLQFVHPVLKEGKEREASYKPFHHLLITLVLWLPKVLVGNSLIIVAFFSGSAKLPMVIM